MTSSRQGRRVPRADTVALRHRTACGGAPARHAARTLGRDPNRTTGHMKRSTCIINIMHAHANDAMMGERTSRNDDETHESTENDESPVHDQIKLTFVWNCIAARPLSKAIDLPW